MSLLSGKALLLKTVNAVLIIGFLAWMLAPKIKRFFAGRRQEIKESLEKPPFKRRMPRSNTENMRKRSTKRLCEIDGIFEMIKAQGVTEKQKIIDDAE